MSSIDYTETAAAIPKVIPLGWFSLFFENGPVYILQVEKPDKDETSRKPFVGVHFRCCNVYARIYLNAAGTAFVGWCPRCARKKAEITVSASGSSTPFFSAD